MTVATFVQPDSSVYDPVTQGGQVDAAVSVLARHGAAFAPHAQATPDMTVRLDAGAIPQWLSVPLEVAAQSTGTIAAPVSNSRKDIVYIDAKTGVVGVATGIPGASPSDPAIPAGKVSVARVTLASTTTAISNSMIDDLRTLEFLGMGTAAGYDAGTAANDVLLLDANGRASSATLQVSSTSRLIGRATSGAGASEELTLSQVLDLIGSAARGDVLYRGSSAWQRLAAGTSGQVLQTLGGGADPQWATVGGGYEFISTASPSGTAVAFTGLASGYDYILWLENVISSGSNAANASLLIQVGVSGTYRTSSYQCTSAVLTSGPSTASDTDGLCLTDARNNGSYGGIMGSVEIIAPADATTKTSLFGIGISSNEVGGIIGGGGYGTAEANDCVRIVNRAGNTLSGTRITLFRRKRS